MMNMGTVYFESHCPADVNTHYSYVNLQLKVLVHGLFESSALKTTVPSSIM